VNYAVAKNVIVCAAAGNCLPTVSVGPAIYPNCIAVAGCNVDDGPWSFSSRGAKVAVTAPAENVWAARRTPGNAATAHRSASQGTSFAVAGVAGIAALWLAFHGRERLLQRYAGNAFLHHVFAQLLRETARASNLLPAGEFGSGIANAHALLTAALPDPGTVVGPATVPELTVLPQTEVVAAMFGDADPNAVRAEMTMLLGGDAAVAADGMAEIDTRANVWAPELIHILAEDQAAYRQFAANLRAIEGLDVTPEAADATGLDREISGDVGRLASRGLRAVLRP
jgi:hypothetical protein